MPSIHRFGTEFLILATVQRQTVEGGRRLLATRGTREGGKVHRLHLAVLKGEPATVGQVLASIQLLLGRGGQVRRHMRLEAAVALGIQRELAAIRAEQVQGIHILGDATVPTSRLPTSRASRECLRKGLPCWGCAECAQEDGAT